MPKIKISPSILSANQEKINEEIKEVEPYSDLIHVDIMDNKFVPNITPQSEYLKKLDTKIPLDIHLMVEDPSNEYIQSFIDANPNLIINNITVHQETCSNLKKTLEYIKSQGIKPGVSIKPKTSLDAIKDVLDIAEFFIIMTVEPGFSGQKFIEEALPKFEELRKLKPDADIEVDGGVKAENVSLAVKAGANVLVASSFIFGSDDKVTAIKQLLDNAK